MNMRVDQTVIPGSDGSDNRPSICWLVSREVVSISTQRIACLESVRNQLVDGAVISAGDGGAIVPLSSGAILIVPVPHPLPINVVLDDGLQNLAWPGWKQAAVMWRSHVILSTLNNLMVPASRRVTITDLLKIAVEVGEQVGADGFGWEGSRLFFPLVAAREMLKGVPLPPDLLIRCSRVAGHMTTKGLRSFNLPEIRDLTSTVEPNAVVSRLWNLASYFIQTSIVIRDGDTIGVDERQSARIRHTHTAEGELMLELHDP